MRDIFRGARPGLFNVVALLCEASKAGYVRKNKVILPFLYNSSFPSA